MADAMNALTQCRRISASATIFQRRHIRRNEVCEGRIEHRLACPEHVYERPAAPCWRGGATLVMHGA